MPDPPENGKGSPMANVLPREKRLAVLAALVDGNSIRAAERMTGVHRDTIMRFGLTVGEGSDRLHNRRVRDLSCSMVDMTDDVVLELLADAMKAHLDGKTQHAQAVAAHLRAEALPSNVLSLDQRRADAAGWSRGAALGAAPFGQVVLEGAEDAERLHRLAHKTGKDRNALLAEAIRRGLRSLEEDPRPNDA